MGKPRNGRCASPRPWGSARAHCEPLESRTLFNVVFTGGPPIQYSGGPTIHNASVVAVYLGAVWNFDQTLQAERAQIDNFLAYFAKSPYVSGLSEYGVSSARYVGDVVDPGTFYNSEVPDAAIRVDLNSLALTTAQLPGEVFLCIAPPGITVSRGEGSDFPAYHDAFINGAGNAVVYSMVTQTLDPSQVPHAINEFDVVTAEISHELAESFTDPLGSLGRLAWAQLPEGIAEGEICDTGGGAERANGYLLSDFWSDVNGIPYVPGAYNPLLTPGPNISLASSSPLARSGQQVIISASVQYPPSAGYGQPTGTVHFTAVKALGASLTSGYYGTIDLGTATLSSNGIASVTISLPVGAYNIDCNYSGDSTFAALEAGTPIRETVGVGSALRVIKQFPPNPTNLVARAGPGRVTLSWTTHSTADTGLVLERSTDGTFQTYTLINVPANKTHYIDMGLPVGARLFYRLYAYNANGPSELFTNVAHVLIRGVPVSHSLRRRVAGETSLIPVISGPAS